MPSDKDAERKASQAPVASRPHLTPVIFVMASCPRAHTPAKLYLESSVQLAAPGNLPPPIATRFFYPTYPQYSRPDSTVVEHSPKLGDVSHSLDWNLLDRCRCRALRDKMSPSRSSQMAARSI